MAKIKFSLSGVGQDAYHDGTMSVDYIYVSPTISSAVLGEQSYQTILSDSSNSSRIAVNYTTSQEYNITTRDGIITRTAGGLEYSIYKREYQTFEKVNKVAGNYVVECSTYVGAWQPVALLTTEPYIRDFNVTSGRSYQYTLYPISGQVKQLYSNVDDDGNSQPVETGWDCWSIAELIPVETPVDAPVVRKAYEVDVNNVWLFRYSLNTGEQTQNFQKQDIQTLGQYNRFGYGQQNFISGNVSCLLGSEIVPYNKYGYIERRRQSIAEPLSTNEKIEMLRQWRKLAFSPNPKLLKDSSSSSIWQQYRCRFSDTR